MLHTTKPRVILLLGAGASYGALDIEDELRPPLGKDLMAYLTKAFPASWGNLTDPSSEVFTPNFEIGMDRLYERVESGDVKNINQLQKDLGVFFSRFDINDRQRHLYSRLARSFHQELASKELSCITLNYDCLLERAILGEGLGLTYVDGPGAEVIKPHGSCNFVADFPNLVTPTDVTFSGGWVDCNLKITDPRSVESISREISQSRFPPAMSIYARNKNNIVCKTAIERFVSKAQKRILEAENVIVIGASPNPNDVHIWGPVQETNAGLSLIAGRDECARWINEHRDDSEYLGNNFFSSFENLTRAIRASLRE